MGQQGEGHLQAGGQQGGVQAVGAPQEQAGHELRDHGPSTEVTEKSLSRQEIIFYTCLYFPSLDITTSAASWPRWTARGWCISSWTCPRSGTLWRWTVTTPEIILGIIIIMVTLVTTRGYKHPTGDFYTLYTFRCLYNFLLFYCPAHLY